MRSSSGPKKYVGIQNDLNGGMTDSGKVIRDAWVFGIIPETETCEGWLMTGIQALWEQTSAEWEKYNYMVSNLPPDLKERFHRIQSKAVADAKAAGWDPEQDFDNE